jgi:2-polyprenyl-3-methyl-5-hydroxy-6-metoxy-1,4-benzoquinol methylase
MFPWSINFEGTHFNYFQCLSCKTVFINPIPDKNTLAKIYTKSDYHDCHYLSEDISGYDSSVKLLLPYLQRDASILDYGCGFGHFLKAAKEAGFKASGVEFDSDAAKIAALRSGCEVFSLEDFLGERDYRRFDSIHMGDVLEHLPDPATTLKSLLSYLKPKGILFIEGPLETNPSPVYWAAYIFSMTKRLIRPKFVGQGTPTHLFRTNAKQQLAFLNLIEPNLERLHWEIHETGWPYSDQGAIKNTIARLSKLIGGRRFGGTIFGNRFTGIFRQV